MKNFLFILYFLFIIIQITSCDKPDKTEPYTQNSVFHQLIEQYKDSLVSSKNEAYRLEYISDFEENFKTVVFNAKINGWIGKYETKKVTPAIIEYYVDFQDFKIRDYASKETSPLKHEKVKNLIDGDFVKIYGKPEPLKQFSFPIKSYGAYNFKKIDIFCVTDSIFKVN